VRRGGGGGGEFLRKGLSRGHLTGEDEGGKGKGFQLDLVPQNGRKRANSVFDRQK